jgi:hypothetical protein
MNSINTTPSDSKGFFPLASESHDNLKHDSSKKILTGKSDLANYILREMKEFQMSGKPIDIELERYQSSFPERCNLRLMLHEAGWSIDSQTVKTEVPNWPDIETAYDFTLHWKIFKKEK